MGFWSKLKEWFKGKPKHVEPPTIEKPSTNPNPPGMKISEAGLELIRHFEGCYLKAYLDPVGVWTIGYGRIKYPDGSKVKQGDSCSQAKAEEWLMEDVEGEGSKYVKAWSHYLPAPLTQNQFDALSSFTYNRGAGRLRQLLAMTGDVGDRLLTFDYAGSPPHPLEGLKRRRWAERAMWLGRDWKLFKGSNWREFAKKP